MDRPHGFEESLLHATDRKQLFQDPELAPERGEQEQRPLGPISDFVANSMPDALADVRIGLATPEQFRERVETIMAVMPPQVIDEVLANPDCRDLASLDINMIASACYYAEGSENPSKPAIPESVQMLVQRFSEATGKIPMLSYEDVIMINPLESDGRTFTQGAVRESELDFYRVHVHAERSLDAAIVNILEALEAARSENVDAAAAALAAAVVEVNDLKEVTKIVRSKMPKEHFLQFRPYFSPIVLTGPSGRWTAGVPVIDTLLGGKSVLSDMVTEYLVEEEPPGTPRIEYFPRDGQRLFRGVVEEVKQRGGIADIPLREEPNEVRINALKLQHALKAFRISHKQAVDRQILKNPEPVIGPTPGTGGVPDVVKFLDKRLERTDRYLDQ